jgi:predicted nucleic acid-binding Zn ribbon protein
MAQNLIHFISSDDRFCGSRQKCQQFTLNDDAVTCPKCNGKRRVYITEQGQRYVDERFPKAAS